ncbi:hypothetical protein ASF28_12830 [Methylobacterium sp. Leaf99]|uniref:hypothetical protein n=1 Tax=Methylobacterium sp. Leaf99 TaxID=1736251 RepID=UPI0006F244BD|nr:hypothetical protein [Methylobacterium sp. Leaf99]KQP07972.1 hypothetical protein ASF28_12830 [Methylobacterium sp. Leaf99]
MRTAERGSDDGDPVRRRVLRLLHVPLLGLLLALGLAPVFLLFPLLPAEPGTDPTLRPVELWLGTALVGGLLFPLLPAEPGTDPTLRPVELWLGTALVGGLVGTVEGAARPLYRAAGFVLAVGLLSIPVLRVFLWTDLPVPHGLARWLGLNGEAALDAHLYEIWLSAWVLAWVLAGLGLALLGRHLPARRARVGRAAV